MKRIEDSFRKHFRIVILSLLLSILVLGCETDKSKENERLLSLLFISQILTTSNNCNLSYYNNSSGIYSEAVQTLGDNPGYCAPVFSSPTNIFANGVRVTSTTIPTGTPLQCRATLASDGTLNSTVLYSWYSKQNSNSNIVNFKLKHTILNSSSGSPIGVDNFTSYIKGDAIYCCQYFGYSNQGACYGKLIAN
ncbi:MAG: hypothetical protein SFU98_10875 [Leptospiraceae bacterium]|nr:hypothetical protein [Leptospiraceae bacterium]